MIIRIPPHSAFASVTLAWFTAGLLSCRDSSGPVPEPGGGHAVMLVAASPTFLTAVVGTSVSELPAVLTTDRDGNPVSGVAVTFVVTRGNSYINSEGVTSNSAGLAVLKYWALGIRPDTHVVEARLGGGPPVEFRVSAIAGPAALLNKIAGDDQVVRPGSRVGISPAVTVTDAFQNPIRGVTVTFNSTNGDDEVSGTSAVSDADGRAALESWTVGALGSHQVVATADTLTPAVFSVVAIDEGPSLCTTERTLAAQSVTGNFGTGSCRTAAGRYFDTYSLNATPGFQIIDMEASSFDSYLELFSSDGNPVARNDNADGSTSNSSVRVFLPVGEVKLTATSLSATSNGDYEIRRRSNVATDRPCDPTFVVRGVELGRELSRSACGGYPIHHYRIYLQENSTLVADVLTLDYSNLYLVLSNASGLELLEGKPLEAPYHTGFTYRAPTSGYYTINVSSSDENAAYQLEIR